MICEHYLSHESSRKTTSRTIHLHFLLSCQCRFEERIGKAHSGRDERVLHAEVRKSMPMMNQFVGTCDRLVNDGSISIERNWSKLAWKESRVHHHYSRPKRNKVLWMSTWMICTDLDQTVRRWT